VCGKGSVSNSVSNLPPAVRIMPLAKEINNPLTRLVRRLCLSFNLGSRGLVMPLSQLWQSPP
jgi:hypothetical protein